MDLTRAPDIDRMRRAKAGWRPTMPAQRRFKGGGSSPPPAPDPVATAQAQGAANKEAVYESARVNQINEQTPYGGVTWTGEIGSPDRTRTTTLTPSQQIQLNQQNQLGENLGAMAIQRAGQIETDPLSFDGLPAYQGGVDLSGLPKRAGTGDYSADELRAEEAAFNRAWGRLDPQFQQERTALETQLANQGIGVGTDAYSRSLADFDRRMNDARIAASYDAINAGQAMNQNLFNQALSARSAALNEELQNVGLNNAARLQGINETQTLRNAPINELAAILQGTPAIGNASFSAPAQYQIAPPDIMGATQANYAGAQNAYATQQQARAANTGAAAGLLGTGAMAAAYW